MSAKLEIEVIDSTQPEPPSADALSAPPAGDPPLSSPPHTREPGAPPEGPREPDAPDVPDAPKPKPVEPASTPPSFIDRGSDAIQSMIGAIPKAMDSVVKSVEKFFDAPGKALEGILDKIPGLSASEPGIAEVDFSKVEAASDSLALTFDRLRESVPESMPGVEGGGDFGGPPEGPPPIPPAGEPPDDAQPPPLPGEEGEGEPVEEVQEAGNAISAFAAKLGPAGLAAVGVTAGFAAVGFAAKKLSDHFEREAERLAGLSAELSAAQAQAEIRQLETDIRRADRIGEDLADFRETQSQFDQTMANLWTEIQGILLELFKLAKPFIDAFMFIIEGLTEFLSWIRDAIGQVIDTLALIFGALEDDAETQDAIRNAARDIRDQMNTADEFEDPFTRDFMEAADRLRRFGRHGGDRPQANLGIGPLGDVGV